MKTLFGLSLALAASILALPASADPRVPLGATAHPAQPSLRPSYVRLAQPAADQPAGAATPKVMGSQTYPGLTDANGFRAYPPSCAADPLPNKASGPTWSARIGLYATDSNGRSYVEPVSITVWRLACSSSGAALDYNPIGAYNAITLVRIDRDSQYEGDMDVWPTFPLISAAQGSIGFGSVASLVRVAAEPNTVIADTAYDSPIFYSTTYVLENYPYENSGYFTFSDAFQLRIDPGPGAGNPATLNIPAYSPTRTTYPDAYNPLPIDGYLTGSWYDPAHGGEGLLINVFGNGSGARTLFAAWFTYDPLGLPFWLTAQAQVPPGKVDVSGVPMYYFTGGGFAGNFGSSADLHAWGTLSLSFVDCNTIKFGYNGSTDAQTNGPKGSGTRTWKRVAEMNGMACE